LPASTALHQGKYGVISIDSECSKSREGSKLQVLI